MQIIHFSTRPEELPGQVTFSLERLIQPQEDIARQDGLPDQASARKILELVEQFPELRTGLRDFSQLDRYGEAIKQLTAPLFPEVLQTNEIKAILVPFQYHAFRPTTRLSNILKNAGPG